MSALIDPATIQAWIAKAEADYKTTRILTAHRKESSPDIICFHAQQCVEKYLKAVLSSRGIHFKKTHDIGELVALLPKDIVFPLSIEEQETLTECAVDSRYPDVEKPIDLEEASAIVKAMESARQALRKVLPKHQ